MRTIVKQLKSATFPIRRDGKVVGTCFAVKGTQLLITASHVISSPSGTPYPNLTIGDHSGGNHPFSVLANDKSSDTSIVVCGLMPTSEGLELGDYDCVEEGDEIFLCGFPFGIEYHITHRGMVSAKTIINGRQSIQVDASVNKGNSGGPCVVNVDGKALVVGVVCTRLVGVDLAKFNGERQTLLNNMNKVDSCFHSGIYNLVVILMNIFHPVLNDLDRFINVGFGEAVSIEYVKHFMDSNRT